MGNIILSIQGWTSNWIIFGCILLYHDWQFIRSIFVVTSKHWLDIIIVGLISSLNIRKSFIITEHRGRTLLGPMFVGNSGICIFTSINLVENSLKDIFVHCFFIFCYFTSFYSNLLETWLMHIMGKFFIQKLLEICTLFPTLLLASGSADVDRWANFLERSSGIY